MSIFVITEGLADSQLLQRLVPQDLASGVQFLAAGGLSHLASMARTALASRRAPVAVVADADTLSPRLIEERRQQIGEVLDVVAGDVPYKVVVTVPEIEAIFFQEPAILERLLGQRIAPEILQKAEVRPKATFDTLFPQFATGAGRSALPQLLSEEDVEALRNSPVVQELSEFLRHAHAWAANKAGARSAV